MAAEAKPEMLGQSAAGGDAMQQQLRALKEDLATLRGDLKAIAGTVGSGARSRLADAKERLTVVAQGAKERIGDVYDGAIEHGQEVADSARGEINKRPLTIVACAFLVGVIAGGLLLRRW
jgi:ElaB/YqjD/DUF883 family membrane-anchored ribosome-binding protein